MKFISKKVATVFLFVLLLCAGAFGYFRFSGYQFGFSEDNRAKIENVAISDATHILNVRFSQPVANLKFLGQEEIPEGIEMQPALAGKWYWSADNSLHFAPKTDWLPDTAYKVTLSEEIFNTQVRPKKYGFSFDSPRFTGQLLSAQFYEDPKNPSHKAATASFQFNYPLNLDHIQDYVSIKAVSGESYDFTYKTDEKHKKLHIISAPLKIGQEENFIHITIADAENEYNKKTLSADVEATVKVPSSRSFFQVKNIQSTILHNESDENKPEQVLSVAFTTAVDIQELKNHMFVYYHPDYCYQTREQFGKSGGKIQALPDLRHLTVTEMPQADGNRRSHALKYDVTDSRGCLVTVIQKGLLSVEGYALEQDVVHFVDLTPYPVEVGIVSDGSIMARDGSRKLAFFSRGAEELNATVARLEEQNINHLVTQTWGDLSHPYFKNYDFNESNISEIFEQKLPINVGHPAQANYSSLDLNTYFQDKKGIFVIKLRGRAGEYRYSNEEVRLIMMTDLGIVVKDNLDDSHEVFVSSISQKKPVEGAKVEVLGRNGLPVLTSLTNGDGVAKFPRFADFRNDKEPVVYKVSLENDISFLPIGQATRYLNFSRFDVGGEYDVTTEEYALKGYAFSDRGIYRPGEVAHFGMIVRQNNLSVPHQLGFLLEIRNPGGDTVATANLVADDAGMMTYDFSVPSTAATGKYSLNLYIKNAQDNMHYITGTSFRVKEFQPDSLRIKAKWDDGTDEGWFSQQEMKVAISLYNLYGNPAVKHQIKSSYKIMQGQFNFNKYAGYIFKNDTEFKKPKKDEIDLSMQTTNDQGQAELVIDLSRFKQKTYKLVLSIEGLETGGGRGVGTTLEKLVSPESYLVGWKTGDDLNYLHKNAVRKIDFIAVDNQLKRIAVHNLRLNLYRKEKIAVLYELPNGTYQYKMTPQEKLVVSQNMQISADDVGATTELKTDEAGDFALKVEDENDQVLADIDYTVAGSSNVTYAIEREAHLGIKLNKTEYNPGDNIEMQIIAPYTGYGLITVERDSVYAYKWFKADTTMITESIVLPTEVEGNAYVNVAFFRDVNSSEIYMPSLSYAVAPFAINKSARRLDIMLEAPQTVKSGQALEIKYKTSEPAKIVVYGVNQGILQVAGYQVPNPLAAFLRKRALRVATAQIMDLLMPDIRILQMLSSIGGDEGYDNEILTRNLNPFARKNEEPVVFWSGILQTDSNKEIYRYQVPDYFNGEIKVMAVAASAEKFGHAEKSVIAHGDFALIPSGPLNVSPDDTFVLGLSVSNLMETMGTDDAVKISMNTEDGFEIVGNREQIVHLGENAEIGLQFRLKALAKLGTHKVTFTAQSVADSRKKSTISYHIGIRPVSMYQSMFTMGYAKSKYKLSGIENLYDEYRLQQLSASSSPLVLAGGLLKYLDKFPHFCTEQTVSKVFPAMEVLFKSPDLVKGTDVYALFNDALNKLRERQTINGGFSAWSSGTQVVDPYTSVFATHFLVQAQKYNFNVPYNMLQRALSYCEELASRAPTDEKDILPAYAAYVLTTYGRITTNYWLNLEEYYKRKYAKTWKNSLGASFMAAGYQMLQDEKKARDLAGNYKSLGDLTADAMNYYLSATHFPNLFKSVAARDTEVLLKNLSTGDFTTKTSAWSVLALNAFDNREIDKEIHFSSGQPVDGPFPTVGFTPETENLTVTSNYPFYYVVAQQGFDKSESFDMSAKGLDVSKEYYDAEGKPLTQANLGDVLTVKVQYRSLQKDSISDVAVVDLLSGCFEVVPDSLQTDWRTDSSEIREDRVIAYVTATPTAASFSYKVKVIAEGKFIVPPVYGSALYQPLVRAHSASSVMQIGE